jgi:hypothetical protein
MVAMSKSTAQLNPAVETKGGGPTYYKILLRTLLRSGYALVLESFWALLET